MERRCCNSSISTKLRENEVNDQLSQNPELVLLDWNEYFNQDFISLVILSLS